MPVKRQNRNHRPAYVCHRVWAHLHSLLFLALPPTNIIFNVFACCSWACLFLLIRCRCWTGVACLCKMLVNQSYSTLPSAAQRGALCQKRTCHFPPASQWIVSFTKVKFEVEKQNNIAIEEIKKVRMSQIKQFKNRVCVNGVLPLRRRWAAAYYRGWTSLWQASQPNALCVSGCSCAGSRGRAEAMIQFSKDSLDRSMQCVRQRWSAAKLATCAGWKSIPASAESQSWPTPGTFRSGKAGWKRPPPLCPCSRDAVWPVQQPWALMSFWPCTASGCSFGRWAFACALNLVHRQNHT